MKPEPRKAEDHGSPVSVSNSFHAGFDCSHVCFLAYHTVVYMNPSMLQVRRFNELEDFIR